VTKKSNPAKLRQNKHIEKNR